VAAAQPLQVVADVASLGVHRVSILPRATTRTRKIRR
jgi:hypothetical protein